MAKKRLKEELEALEAGSSKDRPVKRELLKPREYKVTMVTGDDF